MILQRRICILIFFCSDVTAKKLGLFFTMTRGNPSRSNVNSASNDSLSGLSEDGKRIVEYMRKEFMNITELLSSKTKEIESLRQEVNDLKSIVTKMENSIDDADAYERRDTVVFSGDEIPAVTSGENCANIIVNLLKNKMHIELQPREINTAHRLGKKPSNQTQDKRAIIIKLCRREMKRDIISANRMKVPEQR